jgi:hypothetical protein
MNFCNLKRFMEFKTIGKTFKIPGTVPGRNWPEARAHGARRPATRGRLKHQLGHGLATQPSGATGLRGLLQRARAARVPV